MLRSKAPRVIKTDLFPPKTPVYYYVEGQKQGKWKLGFVAEAKDFIVVVTTNSSGRGHRIQVTYEDIRLAPSSALL